MDTTWYFIHLLLRGLFILVAYGFLVYVMWHIRRAERRSVRTPGPLAARTATLIVIDPGDDSTLARGQSIRIQSDFAIGRTPENDLVLSARYVGRQHARISWSRSQGWNITDLSTPGNTYINGQQARHITVAIFDGDAIELGDAKFEFRSQT